jgi:hypothetical protein
VAAGGSGPSLVPGCPAPSAHKFAEESTCARQRAEETILAEQILLPPEPGTQDSDPPGSSSQPEDPWSPLLEDPSSPYWVEALGGRLTTHSPPGVGTTLHVVLPLTPSR